MRKWSDDLDDAYNKGVQAGEEYERERILTLLEERQDELHRLNEASLVFYSQWIEVLLIIARIKKGNK
jgi:hypothetical protein